MIHTPHDLIGAAGWCLSAVVLGGIAIWAAVRFVEWRDQRKKPDQ